MGENKIVYDQFGFNIELLVGQGIRLVYNKMYILIGIGIFCYVDMLKLKGVKIVKILVYNIVLNGQN